MGFNKRYVNIETIKEIIDDKEELKRYFTKPDVLIFSDKLSEEIYERFMSNGDYRKLLKK
jgi:hypothetical protein